MFIFSDQKPVMAAGFFLVALGVSTANMGMSQTVSDADYLSALDTMVPDMDLAGLAGQTFEAQTVAAPELSEMMADSNTSSCDELQAQADSTGRAMEILGDETTLSTEELAALSKCKLPDSGLLVSYLMLGS